MTAKRAFDIALAGVGLLLSAPVWLIVSIAIRLDSVGPIFYRQTRVGEQGRLFDVLKFRSMIDNAEQHSGPVQAKAHDPRVTRVGTILRATALDELPQLWNIFRGDMSFVGPRALRPAEVESDHDRATPMVEVPGFSDRISVPPGLTGVAQIYARRDISRRQKFRLDRLYVQRRSFLLDMRLILASFWITFRGAWETRGRKL